MKALVKNAISYLRQGVGFTPMTSLARTTDELVPGYSLPIAIEPSSALARRPVGILYADIADYARLTELDEEGTHRQLVAAISSMMRQIARHDGRIAHLAGDAILAEFQDADSALHCAIEVQLAARQWNAGLPLERQVLFRIGVNFGEVISDQGDIYGNAVNLTARLEKLACSGGICVSETVRQRLEHNPAFNFVGIGKQYVKNISEPVQAFWIEVDARHCLQPEGSGMARTSPAAP